MSLTGRTLHTAWDDNFTRINDPNSDRKLALCKICNKTVANTSRKRLESHRKNCPKQFSDCSDSESASNRAPPKSESDEEARVFSANKIKTENIERMDSLFAPNGRKLSKIWKGYFNRVKHPRTQKVAAMCRVCNRLLANTSIKRLNAHRNMCSRSNKHSSDSDGEVKESLILSLRAERQAERVPINDVPYSPSTVWFPSNDQDRMSTSSNSGDILEPKPRRSRLNTRDNKQNLDELFGMYVYSCGNPLKTAESSHLRKFIKALRPDYEIPSVRELTTTIKDHCKKEFLSSLSIASNLFDDDQKVTEVLSTFEKSLDN